MVSSRPLQRLVYRFSGAVLAGSVIVTIIAAIGLLFGKPLHQWFSHAFEAVFLICLLLGWKLQGEPPESPFEIANTHRASFGRAIGCVVGVAIAVLVWFLG
jgi:hypothetical protein